MSSSNMIVLPGGRKVTLPDEFREIAGLCAAEDVVIGGRTVVGVSDLRDLHGGLGVRRVFGAWIEGGIEKYGFREGVDYEVFSQSGNNPLGGRPEKVYRATLHMAKELAMVENNDRGRQIRRYFIWVDDAVHAASAMVESLTPREVGGIMKGVVARQDREVTIPEFRQMLGEAMETIVVLAEAAVDRVVAAKVPALVAAEVRRAIDEYLPVAVGERLAQDPRRVALPYVTSLEIAIQNNVPQHDRRRLVNRITASLKAFCASRHVAPIPDTRGTLMFPRETVAMWLDFGGRGLIKDHVAVMAGQILLALPRPKRRKRVEPETKEAAYLKALSEIAEDRAQRIAAEVKPLNPEMQADALKVHEGRLIRDALKDGIRKAEAVAFSSAVMTRVYEILGRAA